MVLERVRKCPLVYPVYIPYVRCLYPMGEAPGGGVMPHLGTTQGPVMPHLGTTQGPVMPHPGM